MSKKNKTNTEELEKEQESKDSKVSSDHTDTSKETKKEPALSKDEQLENQLAGEKDKFMRLFAEFENYKKRTTKERIELFKTASQDVMVAMLPVLDDFERALSHIEEDKEAEELRKGVLLIYQKLMTTLEQKGLTKIEINKGDTFDAEVHEAVTQIPAPSDDLKGKIIDVIEKGYKLGEKIIRFPKVVTGN